MKSEREARNSSNKTVFHGLTDNSSMEIEISEAHPQRKMNKNSSAVRQHPMSSSQKNRNDIILDVFENELPSTSETSSTTAENTGDFGLVSDEIIAGLQKICTDEQDCERMDAWTIYKVDQNLKSVHQEATFHPMVVSIGPFHRNKSHKLKSMEQHKWRLLLGFLRSMENGDQTSYSSTTGTGIDDAASQKIQYLVLYMKMLETKARACYSETFDDLDSNEFVQMMVLDGCFIIQLLLLFQKSRHNCRSYVDPIYSSRSMLPYLRHDLLLLENQLPFSVLLEIFAMSGVSKEGYKLTELILNFFNPVLFREDKILDVCKQAIHSYEHQHLLDLFKSSFQTGRTDYDPKPLLAFAAFEVPSYFPEYIPSDGHAQDMSIHCVTQLRDAGIEFKKRDHHELLDIEFKGGKLHIPTILIDGNTIPVLLNFVAYEQRHHFAKPYFTSYLMFLNYLVNSSKDVEHLHYKGIINHGLGSDEDVATLFNMLCKEVVQELGSNNYLTELFIDVKKYCGKRRNRWRAAWKHEYFRNPWAFTSFLAAIVLLVLTFLQTYFSMYAYFYPPRI